MSSVYLEHRDAHHVPGACSQAEVKAAVERAAQALASCDALLFTAGAGMGVDSGMPDFRGSTGLWKDRSLALTYEEMSDDKWFSEDPLFAWGVNYTQIMMYRNTQPHAGYGILLRWAQELQKPYMVFTSNIDSHFERAGFSENKVVTCHGDMHHLQCVDRQCRSAEPGGEGDAWSADCIPAGLDRDMDQDALRFRSESALELPAFHCPRCGKLARPNVWFCRDRNYQPRKSASTRRDAFNGWLESLAETKKKLVVVECGGGMAIPTVRVESEDAVESSGPGSLLVRLNPTDCKVPARCGVGIPLGGREGLSQIDAALQAILAARRGAPTAAAAPAGAAERSGSRARGPAAGGSAAAGARGASGGPGRARGVLGAAGARVASGAPGAARVPRHGGAGRGAAKAPAR